MRLPKKHRITHKASDGAEWTFAQSKRAIFLEFRKDNFVRQLSRKKDELSEIALREVSVMIDAYFNMEYNDYVTSFLKLHELIKI